MKFVVYGTNINDLPASHQTDHADMAVLTTVNTSKPGYIDLNHANTHPPLANS